MKVIEEATMPNAHTPGPWSIQQIHDAKNGYADWQTFAIRGPENVCLAMVGEVDHYKSERIPHNARLIAAAPELLEALEEMLNAGVNDDPNMYDRARAAIAKARGEGK
jgi:hypothetical protein